MVRAGAAQENPFAEEPEPTAAWLWRVFTSVGLAIR
jgi:hypothetical protein